MRRTGIHAVALAAVISLVACGQDTPRETTPGATPGTAAPGQPGVGAGAPMTGVQDTREFVQRAMQKNQAEIELSKMAQQRATNRRFGSTRR